MTAALKTRHEDMPVPAALGAAAADALQVPLWVPPEHRVGYRKVAAERGEEEAASWARRMKNGEPVIVALTPRESRLLELRKAGHSVAVTASKAEVTPSAVKKTFRRLRERGVVIPEPVAGPWEWTVALEGRVRTLFHEGLSAGAIAEEIGAPSRNVVIGKIARLGLKRAVKSGHRLATKPKPARVAAPACAKPAAAAKPVLPPPKTVEPKKATTSGEDAPADAITIHDLRESRCHWPFGDPRDDAFRYCGAPVERATRDRGLCYCAGHMAVAYSLGKGRGR